MLMMQRQQQFQQQTQVQGAPGGAYQRPQRHFYQGGPPVAPVGADQYPPFAPPLKQSPLSPQQLMQQVRSPPPGQLVRSPQPSPRPIPSPRQQPIPSPHYPTQTHSPHLGGGPLVEGPPGDLMLPQGGLGSGPSPSQDLAPPPPPQVGDGSDLLTPQEQLNKFVENL